MPNFNANPTSGIAPLTVYFTDSSQNAAVWSWNFGDGNTSSEQNPTHTYSAEGTYTVNLKVNNTIGTSPQTATATVTVQSSSSEGSSGGSSHSSGGSGGGGGGSPEPQSNVETKEISQAFITSGNHAKFDFQRNTTSVVSVSFDSKKTAGKITTIVEMLKEKSTLVTGLPSGKVYKSLNIWVGNGGFATSKNIENAFVCFKVEKSWLQINIIDQSSITLNRYSDKKWDALPTNLSGEDDKYLYFTAKTPGFSPFVITGKTKVKEAVNEIESKPKIGSLEQKNESTATSIEKTPEQKENRSTPGFGIIYGIIGLLGVFLSRRR